MVLSRTVNEINGKFSRKLKKKFNPLHILHPADGVDLGIGCLCKGSKSWNDGATRRSKKFSDRLNYLDTTLAYGRRTDRHLSTAKTALAERHMGKNLSLIFTEHI